MKISNLINKLKKVVVDENYRCLILSTYGFYNNMPDEKYLKKRFKAQIGKELNLENPETFNEKLQWLKLYDRNPEYTILVDKYGVRDYISKVLGKEYLIPLLGVWNKPEDIDFDKLPDQFVLKCNHNSGLGMCICKDKSKLNIKKVIDELHKGLKQNYYITGREWPYKNVPRKIIAEKYMVDSMEEELKDYKIHCFNGEPKIILVCSKRFSKEGLCEDFYDINWKKLDVKRPNCVSSKEISEPPKNLDKMLEYSKILADKKAFVRIDFYEVNGKVYFGEITFYPASGFETFVPEKWDKILGNWIDL